MTFYGPPSPSDHVREVITLPLADWGKLLGIREPDPERNFVTLIRFFNQPANRQALAGAAAIARENLADIGSRRISSACAGNSHLEALIAPPLPAGQAEVHQDVVTCLRFLRICKMNE